MKKWLIDRFLPMWAKETVLADNRHLRGQLRKAQREKEKLLAYIRGMERMTRLGRRAGRPDRGET